MSYCLAISVDEGLVFCSDSRNAAGIDRVSTHGKMYRFGLDGQRQFVILAAGNLGTIQSTLARVQADIRDRASPNLMSVATVKEAADYLGELSLTEQRRHGDLVSMEASFILGGQIAGSQHEVAMVYPQGNHITTSRDTLFLQIGESKYGKPILDRILCPGTGLDTCALGALVSMDSTMRSNLTVGPPVEVLVYRKDSFLLDNYHKLRANSRYLREIRQAWDQRLREAFNQMPPLIWASDWDEQPADQSVSL